VIERIARIAVVFAMGVIMLLVAIGNIFDYGANFDVVQHVLSMDTVPDTPLKWRAVTSPWLHQLFYLFIILAELSTGVLSLYGGVSLWRARAGDARAFNAAKRVAIGGLALGFLLYAFGFMGVGGEWFLMWRSGPYNLEDAAFRFVGLLGLALVFLSQRDVD
jgi:predicted small integral membrane protein